MSLFSNKNRYEPSLTIIRTDHTFFGEEVQLVEAAPDHGRTGRSVVFTPEEAADLRDHAHRSGNAIAQQPRNAPWELYTDERLKGLDPAVIEAWLSRHRKGH